MDMMITRRTDGVWVVEVYHKGETFLDATGLTAAEALAEVGEEIDRLYGEMA